MSNVMSRAGGPGPRLRPIDAIAEGAAKAQGQADAMPSKPIPALPSDADELDENELRPIQELGPLMEVEPPAFLDALVRQRASALFIEQHGGRRREATRQAAAQAATAREALARQAPARQLPAAERWVYIAGLLAYGGQVLASALRLLGRALAG